MFNKDFYPTPLDLTRKMVEKLNADEQWHSKTKYILEPSCGKGDLIENFKKIYDEKSKSQYWRRNETSDKLIIDTIEIEEDLISLLRGKGYSVVWNDFLSYEPQRYYDLILANFPFSNGAKHLLRAIDIQSRVGGKILALINAETIKNPYSNERKHLINLLDKAKADIEYIENAFCDAERKTGVEIAIIYMDIPMQKKSCMFERDFSSDYVDINEDDVNSIARKMNKLEQLCFEYDLIIKSSVKLFEEKMRVDNLLRGFGVNNGLNICDSKVHADKVNVNDFINKTNEEYWNKFINESGLETRLPSKLKDKFRSDLQKQRNIAFNLNNVRYFYEELVAAIPTSYEETIGDLFESVTRKYHYSDNEYNKNIWMYSGWKTNDAYAIKKKIIIPCYLQTSMYTYNLPDMLMDLNIVFNNLAGLSDNQDEFKYNGEVYNNVKECCKKYETTHFLLTAYRKGTIHIEFKDKELLAKFNFLAAKGKTWLREGFEETNYESMNEVEKDIVEKLGFKPEQFKKLQIEQKKRDYLKLLA